MSSTSPSPEYSAETPVNPDQVKQWIAQFVAAISGLLIPDEFKGTSLYCFLLRFARQWHLGHTDLDDLLIEGIKRGIDYIQKQQKPIEKPEAWLRITCLNILKTRVDAAIKEERKTAQLTVLAQHIPSPLAKSELIEQLEFLELALDQLAQEDQELIRMKFLQRKTYEQIRQHMKYTADDNSPVPSVQALRKRESRALQRLRKHFFELYEGGASSSIDR
jgi:RNA polymerase sigma factor (sigma-70 family)